MKKKNDYTFFQNRNCKYFPCHKTDNIDDFNCMFCYCPLYFLKECGGNYKITKSGVKDCTECTIPHYHREIIIEKIKNEIENRKENKN